MMISTLLFVTISQETLADDLTSIFPFHKNLPHRELISSITLFGMMKELDQKFVKPMMTVSSSCCLPAKDRALVAQEFILVLIACKRTTQSSLVTFCAQRYS